MTNRYLVKKHPIGFYEIHPKPSVTELREHYAKKYYQESSGSYQHKYSNEELQYFDVSAHLALATIKKYHATTIMSLLDLGCGEGFFAKAFIEENWKTTLVDFSDDGLRRHNPSLLEYFTQSELLSYIEKNRKDIQSFGLINLDNVLEHVIDPVELLGMLKLNMHPSAVLRIEVPNDFSTFQDLLVDLGCTDKTWICPPEHLSYFNTRSLKALIESQGFELISLQTDFPIEQFLISEHSNYWKNRGLGKEAHRTRVTVTNYMAEQGLDKVITYQEAAANLEFGRLITAYVRATQ